MWKTLSNDQIPETYQQKIEGLLSLSFKIFTATGRMADRGAEIDFNQPIDALLALLFVSPELGFPVFSNHI